MALAAGAPVVLTAAVNAVDILSKVNTTDEALVIYEDTGAVYGQIATVASGSLVNNARASIFASSYRDFDFDQVTDNKHVFILCDETDSYHNKACIITVSGGSPSPSSFTTIDSSPTGIATRADNNVIAVYGSTALAVWRKFDDLDMYAATMTVSGSTVSGVSSLANPGMSTVTNIFSLIPLDSSRWLVCYQLSGVNALKFRVIDTSSGISFGSEYTDPSSYSTAGSMTRDGMDLIATDKVVAGHNGSKNIVLTMSGSTISFGSEYSNGGSTAYCSVEAIASDTVLIARPMAGAAGNDAETLDIAGTTLSSNSDAVTFDATNGTYVTIVNMTSTEAIVAYNKSSVGYTCYITSVPATPSPYALTHSADGIPGAILVTS